MKRPGPGEGVIPVSLIIIMMIKMKGDEVLLNNVGGETFHFWFVPGQGQGCQRLSADSAP